MRENQFLTKGTASSIFYDTEPIQPNIAGASIAGLWVAGIFAKDQLVSRPDGLVYRANNAMTSTVTSFVAGSGTDQWAVVGSGAGAGSEYGEINSIVHATTTTSTTPIDLTGGAFTLPSAGTWEVDMRIFANTNTLISYAKFGIYDNSNVLVANSACLAGGVTGLVYTSTSQKVAITTTGSTTYKIRWYVDSGASAIVLNSSSGQSKVSWVKLSGTIPITGQTSDYFYGRYSGGTYTTGLDTVWTKVNGSLGLTNGTSVLLKAGVTYDLNAKLSMLSSAGGSFQFGFYDSTNTLLSPDAGQGAAYTPNSTTTAMAPAIISLIHTPPTDTLVKVRLSSVTGTIGENSGSRETYFSVKQLGTSATTVSNNGSEFGTLMLAGGSTFTGTTDTDIAGTSFTLPSAGTWEVSYNVGLNNTTTDNVFISIYSASNVIVTDSVSIINSPANIYNNVTQTVRIVTTGGTTYKLRGRANSGSATILSNVNQSSNISWKKIGGYIPSIGQSVDYCYATLNSNMNSAASGIDVGSWTRREGNIVADGVTKFSLRAGKTYELSANFYSNSFSSTTGGFAYINWVDVSNVLLPNATQASLVDSQHTGSLNTQSEARVAITPTVDMDVKLRITSASGNFTLRAESCVMITQLGSTNITIVPDPTPIITRFTANGTWTPNANMKYAIAEVQAGGGGGSSANAISTAVSQIGSGGSGGTYAKVMITKAQAGASKAIAVGIGGTGGVGGASSAGGTSSIGSLVSCIGGNGVGISSQVNSAVIYAGATSPAQATISGCTELLNIKGQNGQSGWAFGASPTGNTMLVKGGDGGTSYMGLAGISETAVSGNGTYSIVISGQGFGWGGAGISASGTNSARTGGTGGVGIVIITEHF